MCTENMLERLKKIPKNTPKFEEQNSRTSKLGYTAANNKEAPASI